MNIKRKIINCCLLIVLLLSGCEQRPSVSETQLNPDEKPIVLTMYHWMGTEAGTAVTRINELFHKEYPNISIQYENAPVDQYQGVIKTRFVSGDAPDLIGVFPGTWKDPFVKSGYLMDLTDSTWSAKLEDKARSTMMTGGKLYAMPVDQNAIGVIYNKKVFKDLKLTIPKSWDEFLEMCEAIKVSGLTPLALGTKDMWVTQIIPLAMAPSAIYHDQPDFDRSMYQGKSSFSRSAWSKMLKDYGELNKRGFFNKGTLGVTYDQMIHLFATEKTAMMIMGTWALKPIQLENPDLEVGMFPLPYTDKGKDAWVSSGVSIGIGASSTTKYPDAVKKYLEFWAKPEINAMFLKEANAFTTFKDVDVELNPAQKEIASYLSNGTYSFLDQKWPPGVQDTLFQGIQNLLINSENSPIQEILKNLDEVFNKNKSSIEVIPE
ncbi:hypothetical protein A8709_13305 [Paenibacillus pectinilyticus]|uniref:ABC transporter substrate-binding protein n=1 Tax=Paenibacillus pectinilyticus TaxID=512399 RepID=A0A1C1A3E9_9BACL|nr:extracellular solute-binding protein [Paenibacillus pectinilyticus]OCT15084.1 hypothetical protein A8709_13305 [Paenibacillus pectinilyticus]